MIEKIVPAMSKTASGDDPIVPLFGPNGRFEKVAGAPPFSEWATGEEIRKFIGKITPADRKEASYILLLALGSSEHYGSNINADWFSWDSLAHEGQDWGYQTFRDAHLFMHHRNQDPKKSFGEPVLSVLNHPMKRIELIVRADRARAREHGGEVFISRVDSGEFYPVSMGCRVPFDLCTVCKHKSRSRSEDCVHLNPPDHLRHTFGKNRILPDGTVIAMDNTLPKFFDISGVLVGADRIARTVTKLAMRGASVCMGDICTTTKTSGVLPKGGTEVGTGRAADRPAEKIAVHKEASAPCCEPCGDSEWLSKLSAVRGTKTSSEKMADIVKSVPAMGFAQKAVPLAESKEPDLPNGLLDSLAGFPLADSLLGATSLGMLLKPREFQRIVLVRMGRGPEADDLDDRCGCFGESKGLDPCDLSGGPIPDILSMLSPFAAGRSSFSQPLGIRISVTRMTQAPKNLTREGGPVLDKISAAYNGYRAAVLGKVSVAAEGAVRDHRIRSAVFGDSLFGAMPKTASSVAGLDTFSYLSTAHYRDRGTLLGLPGVAESVAGDEGLQRLLGVSGA